MIESVFERQVTYTPTGLWVTGTFVGRSAEPEISAVQKNRAESFDRAVISGLLNLPYADFTSSAAELRSKVDDRAFVADPRRIEPSVAEKTAFVREAFGSSIVDLAAMLSVERKTVYSWLDTDHEPRLHARHKARLSTLFMVATQWKKEGFDEMQRAVHAQYGGQSVLGLLSENVIDQEQVYQMFDAIRDSSTGPVKQTSLSDRLGAMGFATPPAGLSSGKSQVRAVPVE